jgi:TolA-binding protein
VEAAEIALDDLMQPGQAEPMLEFAAARLKNATGETASRLHRLRGDWLAGQGAAAEARLAYAEAEAARRLGRTAAQRDAWRGAHSRSTDYFLRTGELDRARDELRRWQTDYPADTSEGYLSLLWVRYWVARNRHQRAIQSADDLLTVNPDSAYADRLLFAAAECQEKLQRADRAAAAYQSLIADYPGSPLVAEARKRLAQLRGGEDATGEAGGRQPETKPPGDSGRRSQP